MGSSTEAVETFGIDCRPLNAAFVERCCRAVARGEPLDDDASDGAFELAYADGTRFLTSRREIAARVAVLPRIRTTTDLPDLSDALTRRLYATYLTLLPSGEFTYPLDTKSDARGCLASILRSPRMGQIYVSRTKPGVVRANHWHGYKVERFLVVEGEAVVRLRRLESDEVTELRVSGARFEGVDVPPGYVHNIENVGAGEMVLVFWVSEEFDPDRMDTHPASIDLESADSPT